MIVLFYELCTYFPGLHLPLFDTTTTSDFATKIPNTCLRLSVLIVYSFRHMGQLLAPVNTHAMQKSCLRLVHDRHQMLNSADRANGNEDKKGNR